MNDFLGHGQADRLLTTLAQRLEGAVGPDDLVARLGGDEFIAVIDGSGGVLDATAHRRRTARDHLDAGPTGW